MNINLHNTTKSVHFMWDMPEKNYKDMLAPLPEESCDTSDYMGAVFFGNIKLEFIRNDVAGLYCNCFEYDVEDTPDNAYSYLEDGTPYEERYVFGDEILLPDIQNAEPSKLPSFQTFAEDIEHQIVAMLGKYTDLISPATYKTVPDKWYPCGHPYKVTVVREA